MLIDLNTPNRFGTGNFNVDKDGNANYKGGITADGVFTIINAQIGSSNTPTPVGIEMWDKDVSYWKKASDTGWLPKDGTEIERLNNLSKNATFSSKVANTFIYIPEGFKITKATCYLYHQSLKNIVLGLPNRRQTKLSTLFTPPFKYIPNIPFFWVFTDTSNISSDELVFDNTVSNACLTNNFGLYLLRDSAFKCYPNFFEKEIYTNNSDDTPKLRMAKKNIQDVYYTDLKSENAILIKDIPGFEKQTTLQKKTIDFSKEAKELLVPGEVNNIAIGDGNIPSDTTFSDAANPFRDYSYGSYSPSALAKMKEIYSKMGDVYGYIQIEGYVPFEEV